VQVSVQDNYMQDKLNKIREKIASLKEQETKIILKLRQTYEKENSTHLIPNVTKTTWKKLEGQLHRTTIYRRKLKLLKK